MFKKCIAAAALVILSSASSSAATLSAVTVTADTGGVLSFCDVQERDADRRNICNSLGEADGDLKKAGVPKGGFTSTKHFDSLTYTFGGLFKGPITIFEVTGGIGPAGNFETLDLEFVAVTGSGANVVGNVENTGGTLVDGTKARYQILFDSLGDAEYSSLIVRDNSGTRDGFEIDAIYVTAVLPLPAGAVLLLTGLGIIGLARRRRA
ncbi:MAG: VPLPA-CTERM sorting domain-containing protein [Pseudomonadota bacterium]